MSDDRELNDGLAAFDQLGRTMSETNRLLHDVQISQTERNRQEQFLSEELKSALRQATGASQKALQASQSKVHSDLLWVGLTSLLIALSGCGAGYYLGHQSGKEQGQVEGYQKSQNQQAAASWANTPSGQRAYALDQRGSLDMLVLCRGNGWTIDHQKNGNVCYPKTDAKGNLTGWYLP